MNIIVKLPYKRPNSLLEENPNWTHEKDNTLWKFISLHSQSNNDTDWTTISNRLNITENQCKLRASYLYKQQFIKLQNEAMSSLSISDGDSTTSNINQQQQQPTQPNQGYSNILETKISPRLNEQQQIHQQKHQQLTQRSQLTNSNNNNINIQRQQPTQPTQQMLHQFKSIDEAKRYKEWVIKNNFDWISISKDLGMPASDCRQLYQTGEHQLQQQQQQQQQQRQASNNNMNILKQQQQQHQSSRAMHNYLSESQYEDNPITQSELIEALIENEEEEEEL